MANSQLLGTQHEIPEEVLEHLRITYKKLSDKSGVKGMKRLNGLLERKTCTYEQLKRIKNYFDHVDPDTVDPVEFELNGGNPMSKWVSWKLEMIRKAIYNNKLARTNAGQDDQFRKNNDTDVSAPNVGAEVKNNRSIMAPPDLMNANELMEQVNKMKNLINKI